MVRPRNKRLNMKIKIAFCLLAAVALLPACTTTRTASSSKWSDDKASRYANNSAGAEPAAPAEGPAEDIPAEGPADVKTNPAYVPTPLLRGSAAAQP
jgi:hypothetical protein